MRDPLIKAKFSRHNGVLPVSAFPRQLFSPCPHFSALLSPAANSSIYQNFKFNFLLLRKYTYKVNRCLARYSPRAITTNQPTNRAPNEPARPGKNANFGPNLDVFGQKILIFTGEIKSFVTHIRKTHLGTLFTLVFGQTLDKMCKKWQYLAQNDQKCRFWTKFGHFWAKNLIFRGVSKSFGTNITENHLGNFF